MAALLLCSLFWASCDHNLPECPNDCVSVVTYEGEILDCHCDKEGVTIVVPSCYEDEVED